MVNNKSTKKTALLAPMKISLKDFPEIAAWSSYLYAKRIKQVLMVLMMCAHSKTVCVWYTECTETAHYGIQKKTQHNIRTLHVSTDFFEYRL